MSYERDSFEHCGLTVRIIQDEDAQNPEEGDTPVYLAHFHRSFEFCGDDLPFSSFDQANSFFFGEGYEEERKEWAIFMLDSYIHSGVHLTLTGSLEAARLPDRGWDVSQCGAILVKKDGAWGISEGKEEPDYEKVARVHVEVWNQYLSGDVWGYIVEDSDGNELESCWGFYGHEYCTEEAKSVAAWYKGKTRPVTLALLGDGTWENKVVQVPQAVGDNKAADWYLNECSEAPSGLQGAFLLSAMSLPKADGGEE